MAQEFKIVSEVLDLDIKDKHFVATLATGKKVSGWKTRKSDGEPTEVFTRVKDSFANGTTWCFKGKINDTGQNEYYNVEFVNEVGDEAERRETASRSPRTDGDDSGDAPASNKRSEPSEGLNTFIFGSLARVAAGLASAGKLDQAEVVAFLLNSYEDIAMFERQAHVQALAEAHLGAQPVE